jgi:hypothetical protein
MAFVALPRQKFENPPITISVAVFIYGLQIMQGDWETLSAKRPTSGYPQHTLTNTGALTVSVYRDKCGNGITRKVKKKWKKLSKQKKTKNLTQRGGKKRNKKRC